MLKWKQAVFIAVYIGLNVLQADVLDKARHRGLHAATLFMVSSAVLCVGSGATLKAPAAAAGPARPAVAWWRVVTGGLPVVLVAAIVLLDGLADGLFVYAQLSLQTSKHVVANHMTVVFGLATMKLAGDLVTGRMVAAGAVVVAGVSMAFVSSLQDLTTMQGLAMALASRLALEGAIVAERRAMAHTTTVVNDAGMAVQVKTASASVVNLLNTALAPVMVGVLCTNPAIRAAMVADVADVGGPLVLLVAAVAAVVRFAGQDRRSSMLAAVVFAGVTYTLLNASENPKLAWATGYGVVSAVIMFLKMHCHDLGCTNATYSGCKTVTMVVTVLRRERTAAALRAMAVLSAGSAALLVFSLQAADQARRMRRALAHAE